jgi:excisionase family DNA binding protein
MAPKLVTAQELAKMLKMSVETIWRYTRTHRIPFVELGKRKYRYDVDQVMRSLGLAAPGPMPDAVRESSPQYYTDKTYTYQDYLVLPDDGRHYYEILDGMLVREPAPNTHHQRVSRRLQHTLIDYFKNVDPDGEIFDAPINMTLSEINVLQPDLIYVPGAKSAIIEQQRINGPPHLVVEILSPSSGAKDRIRKRRIYERLHVPHYWIIDPGEVTIEAYVHQPNGYALCCAVCAGETFAHPDFPGLEIDTVGLWKKHGA